MKLHYYPETDSLYIELSETPGAQTREIVKGLVVDIDASGNVAGFDIDNASAKLDLSRIERSRFPQLTQRSRTGTGCGLGKRMAESTDPKESIALLNELVRRGFSNYFYGQLHHRSGDTINKHISYCKKISEFREGETNAVFQSRLRFVRDAIETKYGANEKVDALRFQQLVDASLRQYPL